MAWNDTMTVIVRNLIGDITPVYKYSDAQIWEGIVVAGVLVNQDFPYFANVYSFDLANIDISPDPTINPIDPVALALFPLKAACMFNLNSYQNSVKNGILVRDGDSEVDTTTAFKGYKDILQLGPCGAYQKLLTALQGRHSMGRGKAIMTPVNITGWGGSDLLPYGIERFYNLFV